jgi:hypothetical protein
MGVNGDFSFAPVPFCPGRSLFPKLPTPKLLQYHELVRNIIYKVFNSRPNEIISEFLKMRYAVTCCLPQSVIVSCVRSVIFVVISFILFFIKCGAIFVGCAQLIGDCARGQEMQMHSVFASIERWGDLVYQIFQDTILLARRFLGSRVISPNLRYVKFAFTFHIIPIVVTVFVSFHVNFQRMQYWFFTLCHSDKLCFMNLHWYFIFNAAILNNFLVHRCMEWTVLFDRQVL